MYLCLFQVKSSRFSSCQTFLAIDSRLFGNFTHVELVHNIGPTHILSSPLISTSDNNSLGTLVAVVLNMLDDTNVNGISNEASHKYPNVHDANHISSRAISLKELDWTGGVNLGQIVAAAIQLTPELFKDCNCLILLTWVSAEWHTHPEDETAKYG